MSSFSPIPVPKHPPWRSQYLVIRALFNREVATRFGEYKLGFFWMLFEPLAGVIIIGFVVGSLAARSVPEIPYPFFLLNGFLLLKLFSSPLNAAVNAVSSNQGLLVYPAVKPIDPFIARFMFYLITVAFSFTLFCIVAAWLGVQLSVGHLDVLAAGFLLTWLLGCGFGLIFGVITAHFVEMDRVVPVLLRPLIFVSAVLYPTSELPNHIQKLLFYNPLVHTIELCREALFPHYSVSGANLTYPTVFVIIVLSTGLVMFQTNRKIITER